MTPKLKIKKFLVFCFILWSFGIIAQVDSLQQSKIEAGIEQWQDGQIILSDGKQHYGQIRCAVKSGYLAERIEFRKNAIDFSQIFLAESCQALQWGEFELFSLPKDVKKPFDKMFYMKIFMGNTIQVFIEPKFTNSSNPKAVRFLVFKEGSYTSVTKSKFKRKTNKLFGDSSLWRDKAMDKEWFKFSNMFEVAKFYDSNMVLVKTNYEDQ